MSKSKLVEALDSILAEAKQAYREKTASAAPEPEPAHPVTEKGAELRKLAELLRASDTDPTYEELNAFVERLP